MAELRPSGFPEYSPSQQLIFDKLKWIIEKNYQSFWYTHIQTPAVERNSVLLSKNWEETGKQIFWLYWMAQWKDDLKEYWLHFDLTVPFARYTLDWENQLAFPFKRYQIQPVWRGERAQKWRYREFYQCDIDVIWKWEKKYLYYDAEIIATLWKTLEDIFNSCEINDIPVFHISNKKLIKSFLWSITSDEEQAQKISNLIDKINKIWEDNFRATLKDDLWISDEIISKIFSFINYKSNSVEELDSLKSLCWVDEYQNGVEELKEVLWCLSHLKDSMWLSFEWAVDLKIIRGLDYYTGTIFEANFKSDEWLWSICWWWRYENLTWYIDPKKNDYCGVGWSIWISRILWKIFDEKESSKWTIADYLFLNFEDTFMDVINLSANFIKDWKSVEIYPESEKLWKQFWYADKKWIPYVIVYWAWEKEQWIYKIKDMKTGEEKQVEIRK